MRKQFYTQVDESGYYFYTPVLVEIPEVWFESR